MTQTEPGSGRIIAAHARALLDYLDDQGFDPGQLYGASLLAGIRADDSGTPVPLALWQAMFETAIAATGDAALALKVGAACRPRHYGMLGYLAMACPTLGEVIAMMGRYERLTDDINESKLLIGDEHAELHWLPVAERASATMAQLSMAGWICFARHLTDRRDLVADASFQFPQPADIRPYEAVFGGHLAFDAAATRLRIPCRYLALRVVHSDPQTHRVLLDQAEALLGQRRGSEPDLVHSIRTCLSGRLASGKVGLADIAAALEISPRTLQRRLSAAGLRYQDLLDAVRRSHAERYLRDPQVSLSDVAFLLGYSEQSPFQNAFRRWLGTTPGAWRKRVQRALDSTPP